jgi:Ferritin-like domain
MVTLTNDLDILNFTLQLQYVESAFYRAVLASNLLSGIELAYAQLFGQHQQEHETALKQLIAQHGGTPAPPAPAYNLPPFKTRDDAIRLLASSEDAGVAAALGLAPLYQNKDLLETAINAHNVEAEHAAIWRDIAGLPAAPDTVAKGLTVDQIVATASQFLSPPAGPAMPTSPSTTVPPTPPSAPRQYFARRLGDG